jgi:hypothetical protein
MSHEYSVRYYPQFHVTAVSLGTYYPRIWGTSVFFTVHILWITTTEMFITTFVVSVINCDKSLYR